MFKIKKNIKLERNVYEIIAFDPINFFNIIQALERGSIGFN